MKGDFSTWKFRPRENLNGVLHQQGRVMRDADLTESDMIALDWQDRAARDIIGAGVCAVPTTEPDGFAIAAARVINGGGGPFIQVSVQPGRAWADGWLVELGGAAAQDFTAP